jgi:hypothetical protein
MKVLRGTACMSTLLKVERENTLDVQIAGDGKAYTLHVHTAGGGKAYTLHIHTASGAPCTSILLW